MGEPTALPDPLARLGAAIVAPKALVRSVLHESRGHWIEWLVPTLVAVAVARPTAFGQALLLGRREPLVGLLRLANAWSQLFAPVIFAALLVGWLANRAHRSSEERDVFAAAIYAVVPLVFVLSVGALAESVGVDRRWLPQSGLAGPLPHRLYIAAVRYGWSMVFFIFVWKATARPPAASSVNTS